MADLARLKSALRKADAAGDTQAATRLANKIRSMQGMTHNAPPNPVLDGKMGVGEGMLRGGFQGGTLGFGDEIIAGGAAALHPLFNPDDGSNISQRYDHYLKSERDKISAFRDQNPGLSLLSEIGGAAPLAIATGGAAMTGRGAGEVALRGAGMGAGEGFAYGFGSGEGLNDRLESAAVGTGVGAVAGASTPIIAAGGRRAIQAVADPIAGLADAVTGRGSTKRAARSISRTMDRSGQSTDDITNTLRSAAADGQPEMIMADALGNSGQRSLAGVARQPGNMRNEIVEYLNNRQNAQGERVAGFVEDGFGFPAKPKTPGTDVVPQGYEFKDTLDDVLDGRIVSAKRAETDLRKARKNIADPAYDAARGGAGPVDVRSALERIDARVGPLESVDMTGDGIDAIYAKYRKRLQGNPAKVGDDVSAVELSDFDRVMGVMQDLQDDIEAAKRAGKGNKVTQLAALKKDLDASMEAASDGYRAANDGFRANSRIIDAVPAGRDMARPGERSVNNEILFNGMSEAEKKAARIGYGDKILTDVERVAPGNDKSRALTTPKLTDDINTMAADPAKLQRQVEREKLMFETRRQATGGSQTADNAADQADVNGQVGMIANLFSGRLGAAAMDGARSVGRTATGMNEATRDIIAKALMSKDPGAALAPVLKQAARDQKTKNVADALMRSGAIRAFTE